MTAGAVMMDTTVGAALTAGRRALVRANIENPALDARLLLAAALAGPAEIAAEDGGPGGLLAARDEPLGPAARRRFDGFISRRAKREPVSRILGRREFWSLPFRLTPDTLDPRPDSETLVEAVLDLVPDRTARLALLDLGTGTGCLLLALLSELPRARGLGVDVSAAALGVARENARNLGFSGRAEFAVSDWGLEVRGARFNFIVTNPPYVAESEIAGLAPEVARFEPRLALLGGADGLAGYRALIPGLTPLMAPGGYAIIEIGAEQAEAVGEILAGNGLKQTEIRRDLAGRPRCIVARTPQGQEICR